MKQEGPSILLLGGGYVLTELAGKLAETSFVITSRSEGKVERFRSLGYLAESVSLDDPDSLSALFSAYPRFTTIIDSVPPLREGDPAAGVKNLLALLPASVEKIFYLSTTGVYGDAKGEWVDESSPLNPYSPQSEARVSVEETYRGGGIATTCFRLSGIYGPGRGVGLRMKSGQYRLIEGEDKFTNRIHRDDIVEILLRALSFTGKLPPALNVTDDEPAKVSEVAAFYTEKFGFPLPQRISREEAQQGGNLRMLQSQRVKNSLIKEIFNYNFTYPTYREGAGTEFPATD